MNDHMHDTICALATPPGTAGLAVVRCSGRDAFRICDTCFRGRTPVSAAADHTIHYGWWNHSDQRIDSVTCSVFRAPNSYTGEDVVEIGCHGGPHVVDQILSSLIAEGCRHAEPGEFTKRAFLHAKLDLTQVEAVADIIHAQSRVGAQTAARQLAGGFTRRLATLRQQLLDVCGLLELELDFSEEDVEFVDRTRLLALLREGITTATTLANAATSAEILRSGFHVAVVGYPNAGKSSLFNALLSRDRALVSDIPGTTRDYLEEAFVVDGYTIRLFDTAGLRTSDDTIEMQGVRLTASVIDQCNVVVIVNDASLGENHSDALSNEISVRIGSRPVLFVQNKADLVDPSGIADVPNTVVVSTITGLGIDRLRTVLAEQAAQSVDTTSDVLVNARQASHLRAVADLLRNAQSAVTTAQPMDVVAVDVRAAIRQLGELAGETWHPDVLASIFSRFCIGK